MIRRTLVAALVALPLLATPADAALCGYDAGTKTAAVAITPGTISTVKVSGSAIQVDGANCGAATTANTDTIDVNGSSANEQLVIDLSGGPFAPGATAEGDGSSEIEWDVDLGEEQTEPAVLVLGSPGADHVAAGLVGPFLDEVSALNLNTDEATRDVDVTLTDFEAIEVQGLGGADVLAATGPEFDATDDLAELKGGVGDDDITAGTITPGPGDDTVRCPGVAGCLEIDYFDAPGPVTITLADGTGGNWGGATEDGEGDADTYVGDPFLIQGSNNGGDVFNGTSIQNVFHGNGGADTLNGGSGIETFRGGTGVDTAHGGDGGDVLYGNADGDFLFGDGGDDILNGSAGDDTETGGAGDDLLRQSGVNQSGGEALAPNGADDLSGGDGVDTIAYGDPDALTPIGRTAGVTVDLDGTADDGAAGEGDNVHADVENLIGGRGNDSLTGDGDPNAFDGFEGDDAIEARDGVADSVTCGTGADSVRGDRVDTIGGDCESVDLPVEMPAETPVTPPSEPPFTPPVTPPVVVPPVVTPPAAAPPVSALLSLPSSRRCASRRKFTVRVRREIRGTVKAVTIFVNGKRVKRVTGTRIGLPIDLRGLPKGTIRVRLRVELKDGRVATDTRRYRTCATKKRRGQFGGRRRG